MQIARNQPFDWHFKQQVSHPKASMCSKEGRAFEAGRVRNAHCGLGACDARFILGNNLFEGGALHGAFGGVLRVLEMPLSNQLHVCAHAACGVGVCQESALTLVGLVEGSKGGRCLLRCPHYPISYA